MTFRRATLILLILIFTCLATCDFAASTQQSNADVLTFLNETVDWYRRAEALVPSSGDSQELLLRSTLMQNASHVVQLGFQFGSAQASLNDGGAGSARSKSLVQSAAAAAQRATQLQAQLDDLQKQIESATGDPLTLLEARREDVASQLSLVKEQHDVRQSLAGFMSTAESGPTATLAEQINQLKHSLPEIDTSAASSTDTKSAAPASSAPQAVFHPETAGIFSLVSEILTLSSAMGQINTLAEQAQHLRDTNDHLRGPVRQAVLDAMRQGDLVTAPTTTPSTNPAAMQAHRQQADALATRIKQLSSSSVPLAEQNVLLDACKQALLSWHAELDEQYHRAVRSLLLRLGTMVVIVLIVMAISELWRRATFKYVHDQRRQRQLVFVRRIVIAAIVIFIITASVVSEFGSLATFAGLITAGVAVALQTVILSGVAYFFFIGRFGVRVGDRVTISGISGDVIEIGLFRIYLLELGGAKSDLHATGRVVVFSNSVLFQSTAFYKQLPGSDYIWHEVALTLSPESDHALAERRLLAAVNRVYADYREVVEAQHEEIRRSLHLDIGAPTPEGRLRFVDAGLEFVVRYPVDIHNSAQIDDRITRELIKAIDEEPKLKLVASGTPRIQSAA